VRHAPGGAKLAAERRKFFIFDSNKMTKFEFLGFLSLQFAACSRRAASFSGNMASHPAAELSHLLSAKTRFKFGVGVPEKK
jgi:hypothetical protein